MISIPLVVSCSRPPPGRLHSHTRQRMIISCLLHTVHDRWRFSQAGQWPPHGSDKFSHHLPWQTRLPSLLHNHGVNPFATFFSSPFIWASSSWLEFFSCGLPSSWRTKATSFFFLRLPFDHHGPVSELPRSNLYTQCCTGPFNWGEAHCAGEKVKHTSRTFKKKSHKDNQTNNKQQQPGRSPPRQPGTPRPGSQLHEPRKEQQTTRDFTMRQIKVRLNVHWSLPDNALIYGSLNKMSIYRNHKQMVMYKPQVLYTMNYTRLNLGETAYTHCHSNRCGHLGHWPSIFVNPKRAKWGQWIRSWSMFQEALGFCRASFPDLAYGTSAQNSRFSLRDIGSISHQRPGGGSLEALPLSRL